MTSAAKVGVFMLVVLGILAFFILRIEDIRLTESRSMRKIEVLFDSVAGLDNKSTVRMAGVRVGKVTDIKPTADGHAKVTLSVDPDIKLHPGASARIANIGLLGEKYVELDIGNPAAPVLTQEQITLRGSQPASIDDVTNKVALIADDVKAITATLRGTLGGPQGQQRMDEIVENVRTITAKMRLLLDVNEGNVNVTAANFRKITDDLRVEIPRIASAIERFANSMNGTVGENREDVRALVGNLKTLSSDLKTTAVNLNDITGQVRAGEGTVGKLFYSDEAHTKLTNALSAVESGVGELKNTLGRVSRIEMNLGIKGEYLAGLEDDPNNQFGGSSRTGVFVNLIPNPERNRFYNFEITNDPRGAKREKVVTTETTTDAGTETITTHQTKYDNGYVVSAQAGWRFDKLSLRAGLIDSTGGLGADYALRNRLSVTTEAYDFADRYDDKPHLKMFGRYTLVPERNNSPEIFLSSGIDNPLNNTTVIFGGGIRWKDEDLKYLLGSIPIK
jgi:phospholipid/cholesterol/gamma-HCH transport system substrate-binding protein